MMLECGMAAGARAELSLQARAGQLGRVTDEEERAREEEEERRLAAAAAATRKPTSSLTERNP